MSNPSDAMNKGYATRVMEFQTATSELFNCDFATRDDGLVLQFHPHAAAQLPELLSAARQAFTDVLGHRADELLRAEIVSDADYDIPPNVFVFVGDFADNPTAARSVFERGIRGTYDRLKLAV